MKTVVFAFGELDFLESGLKVSDRVKFVVLLDRPGQSYTEGTLIVGNIDRHAILVALHCFPDLIRQDVGDAYDRAECLVDRVYAAGMCAKGISWYSSSYGKVVAPHEGAEDIESCVRVAMAENATRFL